MKEINNLLRVSVLINGGTISTFIWLILYLEFFLLTFLCKNVKFDYTIELRPLILSALICTLLLQIGISICQIGTFDKKNI